MEEDIKKYELLCEKVKSIINDINDYYCFDFGYLEDMINEMNELQEKIIKETITFD